NWIVKKIKDFYITYRKKYIIQNKKGGYMTTQWALSDKAIEDHIKQKTTIGIFAGEFITKFLTFDVDGKKYEDVMTLELVNTLVYEFVIDLNNIHIYFSGQKSSYV